MDFLKTSFLSGIATLIKIIAGLIVTKVIAISIGPPGLAIIGQFQNFTNISLLISNSAIYNGIVKYVAEYHNKPEKQAKILSSALLITIILSLFTSLFIIVFKDLIAGHFLHSSKFESIVFLFSFTLILSALHSFLIGILNGYGEIKKYIIVNIVSNINILILTTIFIHFWGIYGALLSLAICHSIVFFVSLMLVLKSKWFKLQNFSMGIDRDSCIKIGKFFIMSIVTAISIPISQIIIRNYITSKISLDAAGLWQGIIKISDVYLLLVTSSISVYCVPKFAQISSNKELKKEIFSNFKIIMPVVIVMALGVYLFRDIAIKLLFTEKFSQMSELFAFQLLGDVIKVLCWFLSAVMTAKAMMGKFIFTELFYNITFTVLGIFFVHEFGLSGITKAFSVAYFLQLIVSSFMLRNIFFDFETDKEESLECN